MAIGAGPLYTNAVMGHSPSASERENVRKASSSILRRDCIQVEESENPSRPDSFSMHFDCTSQAPYSPEQEGSKMMTQTSLLHLPPENPSHDLAFFLRTTGPTAPHRRPSKLDRPQRGASATKGPFRFFKIRQRRSHGSNTSARQQVVDHQSPKDGSRSNSHSLNTDFRDEGGLLRDSEEHSIPRRVKQEVSSEGTKYLALQVPENPVILDSDVYVSVVDGHEVESFDDGTHSCRDKPQWRAPTPAAKVACNLPVHADSNDGTATRPSRLSVQLISPSPQTQEPESALSIAGSEQSEMLDRLAKRSFELLRGVLRHPSHTRTSTSLPLPELLVSREIFIGEESASAKNVDIEQPTPRRFASHPLLLKRASSMIQSAYPRSISDSPAPPPKSPLRLRREPRNIENMALPARERQATPTPRTAPSIMAFGDYSADTQIITPTVVTDCTGPIKRARSRGKNSTTQTDREERIRARKLRDRPIASRTIDAIVNAPSVLPRQRLKKARPHVHIPDFRPASVARRTSSSASSNASWKKVTEVPQPFPIPPVPAQYENNSRNEQKAEYTPISPAASNRSAPEEISISPVMLVAEEIPVPKRKPVPNASKAIVKEGRSYAPRPRSASLPRNSTQRRSRHGTRTPTRPDSPSKDIQHDEAPPLPSPPPTKALPPPPPPVLPPQVPGPLDSRKEKTANPGDVQEAPVSPLEELPPMAVGSKLTAKIPHVATQKQRKRVFANDSAGSTEVHARLEALEKNNALLSAALNAVLRTNGELNGAIPVDAVENARLPMVWESRIARRSAATSGAPRGDGAALEMYLNTRNGGKNGF